MNYSTELQDALDRREKLKFDKRLLTAIKMSCEGSANTEIIEATQITNLEYFFLDLSSEESNKNYFDIEKISVKLLEIAEDIDYINTWIDDNLAEEILP